MNSIEKTFIALALVLMTLGLAAGCQPDDTSVAGVTKTVKDDGNAPVFYYAATETDNGTYSLMVTAKNSDDQDIKGKVWGLELWATNSENIVPATGNVANRVAHWQEGMADGEVLHSGISRTTKPLPSGWYALRGSYYESGVENATSAPPVADQYSAYTLSPSKSQWHYFKVTDECSKHTIKVELDGPKSFGGEMDDNFTILAKTCTTEVKFTLLTCSDFKNLTLAGTINSSSPVLTGHPSEGFRFFSQAHQFSVEWTGISAQAGVAQTFRIPFVTEYSGSSIKVAHGWILKNGEEIMATQKSPLIIQAPAF